MPTDILFYIRYFVYKVILLYKYLGTKLLIIIIDLMFFFFLKSIIIIK